MSRARRVKPSKVANVGHLRRMKMLWALMSLWP